MDNAKQLAIKNIVKQEGWQFIEDLFKEEVLEGKKPLNFKTEGKTAEMIALEVIARQQSAKIVDKVLKRLNSIANHKEYEKESYR